MSAGADLKRAEAEVVEADRRLETLRRQRAEAFTIGNLPLLRTIDDQLAGARLAKDHAKLRLSQLRGSGPSGDAA